MKDLPGLSENISLLLFGILQKVTKVIIRLIGRRKKFLLKSSEVRMGSGDLVNKPLLLSTSLLYM
jgi:hypothetical protein